MHAHIYYHLINNDILYYYCSSDLQAKEMSKGKFKSLTF